ncbi:hypothetical protein [Thermophilibacter immobilis]|uniref:DUF559 domain-containing protein n=1 Tax=Thermophilibacter immobilis TaxID=2779519 RepID=A0A7S7M8Y7_9ACTN|nr:hypothetical protein [Thermophilibacter immobilis]QOY60881.1 hypothetical protein INP52_01285 [Thermophilibacter immobilis]
MSRNVQQALAADLDEAECEHRLLVPRDRLDRRRLRALQRRGGVIQPVPGAFARPAHWASLTPIERAGQELRATATMHPRWTFGLTSAALVYGLQVSHRRLQSICVAVESRHRTRSHGRYARVSVEGDRGGEVRGIRVTLFWQTVADCLRYLDFEEGLALADSVLRLGFTPGELVVQVDALTRHRPGRRHALRTLEAADGRSENGGESIARAVMLELGFQTPELQVEVADPVERSSRFRVDFMWRTESGRLIAGELDGREKYRNPSMTAGRDAIDVLSDERLRESRLTSVVDAVVRFSFADVIHRWRLARILTAFGVPRVGLERRHEPGLLARPIRRHRRSRGKFYARYRLGDWALRVAVHDLRVLVA